MASTYAQNDPILIGHRFARGGEVPFGVHPRDARHQVYVIGKTGSGTTTLLRNLIRQHIHRGHGVAVIDPHGDLAEELLAHLPPHRADDRVYFDRADIEFPVAFNPLAGVPPDERPLVALGNVESFKAIWADSWGPRMACILCNCMAALLGRVRAGTRRGDNLQVCHDRPPPRTGGLRLAEGTLTTIWTG